MVYRIVENKSGRLRFVVIGPGVEHPCLIRSEAEEVQHVAEEAYSAGYSQCYADHTTNRPKKKDTP